MNTTTTPTRALVTGAGGFAGRHLMDHLLKVTDWDLYGNIHMTPDEPPDTERVQWVNADLTKREQAESLIEQTRPQYVFHLAAQSNVPMAFKDPEGTIMNNVVGQLNLLDALREVSPDARILVIGSSEQYGLVLPKDVPISEDAPFRPNNPYAVSKIAQDALALQYFLTYGQKTIRVRPFNHLGPGQNEHFVAAAFAQQVARIEANLQEPVIYVGNLEAVRDFTDVGDMIRAYHLAITRGEPGEAYNIGSGQGHTIQWLLDTLIYMSHVTVEIKQDPTRMRPSDIPTNVCDPTRFTQQTGWQPQVPLEQTLRDVLNYWRERVRDA